MSAKQEYHWYPFYTLFRREIARFMKVLGQTVLIPLVNSGLYLMIFGVSLGHQIVVQGQSSYLAFLIPGLVMMGCLNNAFQNSSSSIITSKFSGDLEDLKAAPFSIMQIIWALGLAALVRGLMVGGVTWAVGEVSHFAIYGQWLGIAHPLVLAVFLVLGSLTFANLGISVAFWARTFEQMSAVSGFILLPLIYLGGVFFSVEHLPGFWKDVSLANPLLYMINGVRYGILGAADVEPGIALAVSLAAMTGTLLLAAQSLRTGSFQRW
ncbi:MAG TPA: ABC transporter permease [Bdellovibrionales bacterium]|nr:ABC transporter permease [Bdellovibrionales bacterium]